MTNATFSLSEPRMDDLPALDRDRLHPIDGTDLALPGCAIHPPRILLLYGSLRPRSYSRFLTLEAERLLRHLGCETRVFHADGLPLPDGAPADHPKVAELRALSLWSEGQVWCSPERHGTITGVMKSQIDWLPAGGTRRAPHPGPDAGGDAGVGRLAILQRRQRDASARALDADGHHSEPILRRQGLR